MGYGLAYIDSSTVFKRRLIKARINVIYTADSNALKSVLFTKENEINDLRRSVCTCNHGTENHRYWHEISVRKQTPEVVLDGTTPPNDLKEDKWNCHTHQPAVFYNEPLVPWRARIECFKGLGLGRSQSLTWKVTNITMRWFIFIIGLLISDIYAEVFCLNYFEYS